MSKQIKLIKTVVSQEAGGNWGTPTETKYTMFADVEGQGSARSYQLQTLLGATKRFRIPYKFTLDPTGDWEIEFRRKRWTIQSIEPEDEQLFKWIITANHK